MEPLDVYTADRVKTGLTMDREKPIPAGQYCLVVHICIFDSRGRMLIQQRQPFKRGWSNMWDVTVGGCAQSGDTSRTAAERETREELGLEVDLKEERAALTVNFSKGFDDYYVLTRDLDPATLKLQPEEVQAVRWATKEDILAMIDEGSFIPYEKSLIEFLFTRQSNRSAHSWDK